MESPFKHSGARPIRERVVRSAAAAFVVGAAASSARAQLLFSIDYKGATNGASTVGGMIRESDLLRAPGGQPSFRPTTPPLVQINGQQIGLPQYAACATPQAGFPCHIELDAVSTGFDARFNTDPNPLNRPRLFFSVDFQSRGVPAGPPPTLFTEAAVNEAAADLFTPYNLPPGPLPPSAVPLPRNVLVIDGSGDAGPSPFIRRGLGLVEPNVIPVPPPPPNPPYSIGGDDLDAVALHPPAVPIGPIFFSLDGAIVDPVTGFPGSNSASAAGGFLPGDVLVKLPGQPPSVYASAARLGLDLAGPGTDDLDVLLLAENGDGVWQKSHADYDWLPGAPGGPSDMLIFSVRRGSALVVNQVPDSRFGIPIEEGDLLIAPYGTPLASIPPAIWIAAENLGLRTRRGGAMQADDLDGGANGEVCYDCNGNGIEDAVDISTGSSVDVNGNGVPDECETSSAMLCDCPSSAPPPCGNAGAAGRGCGNSAFAGGALLAASGPSSVAFDAVTLNASDITGSLAIFFQGASTLPPAIVDDGIGCVGGPIIRLGNKPASSNASSYPQSGDQSVSVRGAIPAPGGTYYYQCYYRNAVGSFCPPATSNRTNAISIVWFP